MHTSPAMAIASVTVAPPTCLLVNSLSSQLKLHEHAIDSILSSVESQSFTPPLLMPALELLEVLESNYVDCSD